MKLEQFAKMNRTRSTGSFKSTGQLNRSAPEKKFKAVHQVSLSGYGAKSNSGKEKKAIHSFINLSIPVRY